MCPNFEQENDNASTTFQQMARKIHKNGKINDFLPVRFFKFLAKILKEFISNQHNVLSYGLTHVSFCENFWIGSNLKTLKKTLFQVEIQQR